MFVLAHILAEAQQGTSDRPPIADAMPMIIIFGMVMLFFWVTSRSEKKRKIEMLGALKKKDKVVTIAGIIAIVDSVKDDEVTLRIDENSPARLRVLKSAIDRIIRSEDDKKDTDKEEKESKD